MKCLYSHPKVMNDLRKCDSIGFCICIHVMLGISVPCQVNGRIVPRHNLRLYIVDLQPSSSGPSRDWLNIVKTSKRKTERQFFKRGKRREYSQGKEMLEREAKRQVIHFPTIEQDCQNPYEYGFHSEDDMYCP